MWYHLSNKNVADNLGDICAGTEATLYSNIAQCGVTDARPLGGGNRPSISPGLPNHRLFFSSESLIFPEFPCISMHFQYLSGVKDGEGKCFHIRCILSGLGGQYCRHVQLTVSRWTALQNAEKSTKMLVWQWQSGIPPKWQILTNKDINGYNGDLPVD